MSHYFSTVIRIAGKPQDVANFHGRIMVREGERPSDTFKFEMLALNLEGRTVGYTYKAGQDRYPPTAETFAYSGEAAGIPVVTQISRYYEDGTASFQVFFGRVKLFEAYNVYCLGKDEHDTSIPPEATAADRSFSVAAREKFGVSIPGKPGVEVDVAY